MILKIRLNILLIFSPLFGITQNLDFSKHWESLGPNELPINKDISTAGIGPVEFIRIGNINSELMLAGSLNGGLFYSNNGGKFWQNSGSDNWDYSACAWAEIHPTKNNTWFALSIELAKKGLPSKLGKLGRLMRTRDSGLTWENIASYKDFDNNSFIIPYGIRCHPNQANKLYVLTSRGVFYTNDCLSEKVQWQKIPNYNSKIYDLEIIDEEICFSTNEKGKWQVLLSNKQNESKIVDQINAESRDIKSISIEKGKNLFYLLIDFVKYKDEIWTFDPKSKKVEVICKKAYVLFGMGYSFAVNPFDENEILLGYGLRTQKWIISKQRFLRLGTKYHVDIEHIIYHPKIKNKIYIATHGGVYMSVDGGTNWEFSSDGVGIAEVYGMGVSEKDPNQIVVGLNHDGSLVRADWERNGNYKWRLVNGGDALLPQMHPKKQNVVYTSNQYTGGGLYYSEDTAKTNTNLHKLNNFRTSSWSMTSTLHSQNDSVIFFNFKHNKSVNNQSVDVARMVNANKMSTQIISNFHMTHGLEKYQVLSLFASKNHSDILLAYVIEEVKDAKGKAIKRHHLYKTSEILDTASKVINNWKELELPDDRWVAQVVMDPKKWNKMYISYVVGKPPKTSDQSNNGMVYYTKYKKSSHKQSRTWDISNNIQSGIGGKRNMLVTTVNGSKLVFIAVQSGVYVGDKQTLKGKKEWRKVGVGLPHCRVYGIHYHKEQKLLTAALKGRGVWRINLTKD